mmetsp:Transcript_176793/g.567052  ORF Transcript_176793/g.567052 Transcript_176793/m.567052 type:complete len:366 (-) Transcript_176793:1176-2273(-)
MRRPWTKSRSSPQPKSRRTRRKLTAQLLRKRRPHRPAKRVSRRRMPPTRTQSTRLPRGSRRGSSPRGRRLSDEPGKRPSRRPRGRPGSWRQWLSGGRKRRRSARQPRTQQSDRRGPSRRQSRRSSERPRRRPTDSWTPKRKRRRRIKPQSGRPSRRVRKSQSWRLRRGPSQQRKEQQTMATRRQRRRRPKSSPRVGRTWPRTASPRQMTRMICPRAPLGTASRWPPTPRSSCHSSRKAPRTTMLWASMGRTSRSRNSRTCPPWEVCPSPPWSSRASPRTTPRSPSGSSWTLGDCSAHTTSSSCRMTRRSWVTTTRSSTSSTLRSRPCASSCSSNTRVRALLRHSTSRAWKATSCIGASMQPRRTR